MSPSVEAAFTRTEKFLRAVVFLKDGKENVDAPVSIIFSSKGRDYIFIPSAASAKVDPVYPEAGTGQFVHRIEKGIYHATLFGKNAELGRIKKAKVFVAGTVHEFNI